MKNFPIMHMLQPKANLRKPVKYLCLAQWPSPLFLDFACHVTAIGVVHYNAQLSLFGFVDLDELHNIWVRQGFKKFGLFRKLGNKNFLAWVSSRLRPMLYTESSYFYVRGDVIDNFYFGTRGTSAFVMPIHNNAFAIVDPQAYNSRKNKKKQLIHQYFGLEDVVINVAAVVHDQHRSSDQDFLFSRNGFKTTNRRYFSVQSLQNTEVLILNMIDVDSMKRDY